jgi:hypothetical protein
VILKLHPHEYSVKTTKEILNLEKVLDFTIVKDVDLYSLFAQSEFQAGVFWDQCGAAATAHSLAGVL